MEGYKNIMTRPLTMLEVIIVFMLLEIIKESAKWISYQVANRNRRVITVSGEQLKRFIEEVEREKEKENETK